MEFLGKRRCYTRDRAYGRTTMLDEALVN